MNENQLDKQAVNLAKAIRRAETGSSTDPYNARGASGEIGGYQFMPDTWKNLSKKHLGDENAPLSVENQNKVAYMEIKSLKDQGYTPAQIASIWNSGQADTYKTGGVGVNAQGVEYNVPKYVSTVSNYYRELSGTPQVQAQTVETEQQPVEQDKKKSVGGFLGNVFESGLGLIAGTAQAIAHPIQTAKTLGGTAVGAVQKLIPGEQKQEQYVNTLGQYFKDRYGSAEAIGNTAYSDPVGFLTDVSTVLSGGGVAVTKLGQLSKVGELTKAGSLAQKAGKVASVVDMPGKAIEKVKEVAQPTAIKAAQKLEARNLAMTPSAKRKLIVKESTVDRIPELSETEAIKYGTSRKLTGTPEERLLTHKDFVEDLETQIDRAVKNSRQTVPKKQLVNELDSLAESFAGEPELYDSIRSVVDKKINHINTKIKGDVLTMEEVQKLKKDAWKASKFDTAVPSNTRFAQKQSGHIFKNTIEDAFERGGETIFGKTPKEFNAEYGKALAYEKLLEQALGKSEIGISGRAAGAITGSAIMNVLGSGPLGEAAGLYGGERLSRILTGTKTRSKIGAGLQNVTQPGRKGLLRKALGKVKPVTVPGYYAKEIEERK